MRRLSALIGVFGVIWVVSASAAVPTVEDLDKLMKRTGSSQQAVQKAITAGDAAEARKQIANVKSAISDVQEFWTANKKPDAFEMGKTVLAKLDALDKVVAAPTLDSAKAGAAIREVGTACAACHRAYRTSDEDKGFILKPGTIPGA
jgi:cytochrome c556